MNRIISRDRAIEVAIRALKWAANQGEQVDEEEAVEAIATLTTPAPAGQVGEVVKALEFYSRHHHCLNTTAPNWAREALEALRQPVEPVDYNDIPDDQLIGILTARWKMKKDFQGFAGPFIRALRTQPQAPVVEVLKDKIAKLVDRSGDENWTDGRLTDAICALLSRTGGGR